MSHGLKEGLWEGYYYTILITKDRVNGAWVKDVGGALDRPLVDGGWKIGEELLLSAKLTIPLEVI